MSDVQTAPIMDVTPIFHEGVYAYEILTFWCPGCKAAHQVRHEEGHWHWNGDRERPSITPSIKVVGPPKFLRKRDTVCHSHVTDGAWNYLSDSNHELAGQQVPLPPLPEWLLPPVPPG